MEGTARIWFTPQQRAELWERWPRCLFLTQSRPAVQLGGKLGQGMRPSAFRAERTAVRAPMRSR